MTPEQEIKYLRHKIAASERELTRFIAKHPGVSVDLPDLTQMRVRLAELTARRSDEVV